MRPLLSLAVIAPAAVALTGCGTIISSPLQTIKTTSRPQGAEVIVDGMPRGKTPTDVELSRWEDHDVTIELRGYQPYHLHLSRNMNPFVALNIANGFFPGVLVDVNTGAIYRLEPAEIQVDLFPRGVRRRTVVVEHEHASIQNAKGGRLSVATTNQPKSHWQKIGQMERL